MARKRTKEKVSQRARRKRERRPSPMLQSALEHHRGGRLHEAARLYENLVEQNPRHSDALASLKGPWPLIPCIPLTTSLWALVFLHSAS